MRGAVVGGADALTLGMFDFAATETSYFGNEEAFEAARDDPFFFGFSLGEWVGYPLLLASGTYAWQATGGATFGVLAGRNGHAVYSVTSEGITGWWHLAGLGRVGVPVTTRVAMRTVDNALRIWGVEASLQGVPILFPVAATGIVGGSNCFTTCSSAFRAGLLSF